MFEKRNPNQLPERQETALWKWDAEKIQFYCLIAAVGIEVLFLVLGSLLGYVMYYYVQDYLLIPCAVFLTASFLKGIPGQAKKQLLLGLGMAAWFLITQSQHKMQGMDAQRIGMFFTVYLLAFPFAAITRDGVRQRGLKIAAWGYIAVSMMLCVYALLLLFDVLPAFLEPYILWDGARLQAMWHSNICACLFMIGIALCFGFCFQAEKLGQKIGLLAAALLQFICLVLTNCRTSVLMTCALVGGIVFFVIWKDGWKRFAIGLLAALVVMAGLFVASSKLYQVHNAHLIAKYTQEQPQLGEEASNAVDGDAGADEAKQPETPPLHMNNAGQLQGVSGQGSLSNDLRTLNGRTGIWKAALTSLRDNPSLLVWGTEYVGVMISVYHSAEVVHAHNSWMEILFRMGLPGLVMALIFTWMAVRSCLYLLWRNRDMWKTCLALLVLCMLVAGFLEPFFFAADISYHYLDFFLLLCIGYTEQWWKEDSLKN